MQVKKPYWILIFFILIFGILPTAAQNQFNLGSDPILLKDNTGLWAYDIASQTKVQLLSEPSGSPILSPDGNRVAYTVFAPIFKEWLTTTNGAGGFQAPEDLFILDLSTGEVFAIAEQAADASFTGPNPDNAGQYTLRSQATWSPDSQKLAWLEFPVIRPGTSQEAPLAELKVYDFTTGETSSFETFSFINNSSPVDNFDLSWGRTGLAFLARYFDPILSELHVYDVSGNLIASTRIEAEQLFFDSWIQTETEDYLYTGYGNSFINWQTAQIENLNGQLEMVSLIADSSTRFFGERGNLYLTLPEQTATDLGVATKPIGISRDGQCALYGISEANPSTGIHGIKLIAHCVDTLVEIGWYQDVDAVWGPTILQMSS